MGKRRHFSEEFKREAACLVLDQDYSVKDACESMGMGPTALRRWVESLKNERAGITPEKGKALTPEYQQIQSLKAQIRKLEREKEILKKATALLMSE